MLLCIFRSVEMNGMQSNAKFLAKCNNKPLIAVALFTAQVEIAVHGLAIIAQVMQYKEQSNGIGTATQCNKHRLALF